MKKYNTKVPVISRILRQKSLNPANTITLSNVAAPFLILENKRVIFASDFLKKYVTGFEDVYINDIAPGYSPGIRRVVTFDDKNYLLYTTGVESNGNLSVVYFVPVGGFFRQDSSVFGRIIIALVFIDNFDEVLETVEEIKRPGLIALIDRKINSMTQQVKGILSKFEKDKFLLIFTDEMLDYLKEKRFEILNSIREINLGNQFPVTLSIGIGVNGNSLMQTMEFARAAIDLALGRGGDQVLIKDRDKYFFFGGVVPEVAINSRVRARAKLYALTELILECKNCIILGHKNVDTDCLGAAVGVYRIVNQKNKECNIVLEEVNPGIQNIYSQLIKEEEYNGHVFINIKTALSKVKENTLVIVVDTNRPGIVEGQEILNCPEVKKVVVLDHHRKAADFIENPVLAYHETYASSTCELVCEMMQYTKEPIKLKQIEADLMLSGITVDTKNFTLKTGAKTFEAAAFLRRNGADSARVKVYMQSDVEAFKAKAAVVSKAEIYVDNIAISYCNHTKLTAAQSADELLNISGVTASFVLCKTGSDIFISARSLGKINVQLIMEKLGGGGHQTISAAQLTGYSFDEAEAVLKDAINTTIKEN